MFSGGRETVHWEQMGLHAYFSSEPAEGDSFFINFVSIFSFIKPILAQCSISIPPENVRNPLVF